MKYRSEIDGLRAIAVIPVILFHAGFEQFSGGFVGVDVFFVISGYLITTIILSEKENGTFSLINFYERRARRILPALFLVMLVSLPFAWMWLFPQDMQSFSKSLIAVSAFASNITFWLEIDYFDATSELKPLLHTWSLAVEEQYYVLFPLFLMFMWRFRKRWILGSFMIIALISLAVAQWGAYHKPSATFFLLPTRGWELAIGAAIAFYFLYRKQEMRTLLSHKSIDEGFAILGLFMICYSVFLFDKSIPFPGLYALVPTIGTGLIIIFASSETLVGRLLGTKPLVAIGLISYSAYLWHQPLLVFARHRLFEPDEWTYVFLIVMTFLFAYLSWQFVEKPFRKRDKISRKTIFTFTAVGSLFFIGVGLVGYLSDGFISREVRKDLSIKNYEPDNRILQKNSWDYLREISGDRNYGVMNNSFDLKKWFDLEDSRQRLLVVGNSHSKDVFNVLLSSESISKQFQLARFGAQIRSLDKTFFESENYKLAHVIIFASRYSKEDLEKIDGIISRTFSDGKKVALVRNIYEYRQYNIKRYNLADKLVQTREGEIQPDFVSRVNRQHYLEYKENKRKLLHIQSDKKLDNLTKHYKDLIILDRMDYVCDTEKKQCFAINEKLEKYFYDYGHHTKAGARYFGRKVDEVGWLREIINE